MSELKTAFGLQGQELTLDPSGRSETLLRTANRMTEQAIGWLRRRDGIQSLR